MTEEVLWEETNPWGVRYRLSRRRRELAGGEEYDDFKLECDDGSGWHVIQDLHDVVQAFGRLLSNHRGESLPKYRPITVDKVFSDLKRLAGVLGINGVETENLADAAIAVLLKRMPS